MAIIQTINHIRFLHILCNHNFDKRKDKLYIISEKISKILAQIISCTEFCWHSYFHGRIMRADSAPMTPHSHIEYNNLYVKWEVFLPMIIISVITKYSKSTEVRIYISTQFFKYIYVNFFYSCSMIPGIKHTFSQIIEISILSPPLCYKILDRKNSWIFDRRSHNTRVFNLQN